MVKSGKWFQFVVQPNTLPKGRTHWQIVLTVWAIGWLLLTVKFTANPWIESLGVDLRAFQIQIVIGYMLSWLCLLPGRRIGLLFSMGCLICGGAGFCDWLMVIDQVSQASYCGIPYLYGCHPVIGSINIAFFAFIISSTLYGIVEQCCHYVDSNLQ